jgi:hypothetical protein
VGDRIDLSYIHPGAALDYARHPSGSPSRSIPFVIWLVIVLGALAMIRKGGPSAISSSVVITYLACGGAIVLVATVAPEVVTQMLIVLVILAFLVDIPYLTPGIDWVQARVRTLSPV